MMFVVLLFLFIFFWLGVKFTGGLLKLCYIMCIGLPLAVLVGAMGFMLCCTIILMPIGVGMIHLAGKLLAPF